MRGVLRSGRILLASAMAVALLVSNAQVSAAPSSAITVEAAEARLEAALAKAVTPELREAYEEWRATFPLVAVNRALETPVTAPIPDAGVAARIAATLRATRDGQIAAPQTLAAVALRDEVFASDAYAVFVDEVTAALEDPAVVIYLESIARETTHDLTSRGIGRILRKVAVAAVIVGGAVAAVGAVIACSTPPITVGCIVVAAGGAVAFAGGTVILLQDELQNDATHHVDITGLSCLSPTSCQGSASLASTASYSGATTIFSFSGRAGIIGYTYGFPSNNVRFDGNTVGIKRYTLNSSYSSPYIDCYSIIRYEVTINWNDGKRTYDELELNKPATTSCA